LLTPYVLLCATIGRLSGAVFVTLYSGYIIYSFAG